jgi:tetratricopeptide (TPR) repeat protein
MAASDVSTGRQRLDSWKEIAAFFGRDERTVNRWEKERGLPVHRLPGAKGRVYAYADELRAWLAASENAEAVAAEPSRPALIAEAHHVVRSRTTEELAGPRTPSSSGRFWNAMRLAVGAGMVLGVVALLLFFRASPGKTPSLAAHSGTVSKTAVSRGIVLASTPTHDPEAEQLYLKGRYYWNKRTPEDLNQALDYFMQAIVHDPNYSQAYVGLADCYSLMREYTRMPSNEAYARALAAATKAVELDDQSSEAHASLGFVSFFGIWDLSSGEREFRRAVDLNPNNAVAHHWYANALLALNRVPESLAEIERAQALDPSSTSILADRGNLLLVAGRWKEAIPLLKQMEEREPGFRSPHLYLKYAYLSHQDYPDFLSELRTDAMLVHDDSALAVAAAAEKGFAADGELGMLQGMLAVQKRLYGRHAVSPTELAKTYALLGNKNEAVRCLKAAYEQRDGALLFVETTAGFDSLRDDSVYRELVAHIGLPAIAP